MSYGMRMVYMGHCYSGDRENLVKARAWLKFFHEQLQDVVVLAPWILDCEMLDDRDLKIRELGLQRDEAVVARCAETWLVGPRVSPGMLREARAALRHDRPVWDLTGYGMEQRVIHAIRGISTPMGGVRGLGRLHTRWPSDWEQPEPRRKIA